MQEAAGELLGPKDAAAGAAGTGNPFARELLDEIHEWEEEGLVERDGYLLFLCVAPRVESESPALLTCPTLRQKSATLAVYTSTHPDITRAYYAVFSPRRRPQ